MDYAKPPLAFSLDYDSFDATVDFSIDLDPHISYLG
jgi:hypothetical protein